MRKLTIFRTGLAAAALSLCTVPVKASPTIGTLSSTTAAGDYYFGGVTKTTLYYGSSNLMPEAAGTIVTTGNAFGGLCQPGFFNGCSTTSGTQVLGPLSSGGITATNPTSGIISIVTPTNGSPGENYLLTLTVGEGSGLTGDIWDLVLNGVSTGTLNTVSLGTAGSQTAQVVVHGNQTELLSVTDLLIQYDGLADPYGGGTVGTQSTLFTLKANIVPDPEPASIGIFLGGLAMLGAARRRRSR